MLLIKRFAAWMIVRPLGRLTSAVVFIASVASIVQAYYSLYDHHFRLVSSINLQENGNTLSSPINVPPVYQAGTPVTSLEIPGTLINQEDDLKSYLRSSITRRGAVHNSDRENALLVLAQPPFLSARNGVGHCSIKASIVSGGRTLVFQNEFEGISNSTVTNDLKYLQTQACHRAIDNMLRELDP